MTWTPATILAECEPVNGRRDHRDIVIEDLADSEAALIDRIVDLELDNRALRETLHAAVDGLHHITGERDRLWAQHHRLIDEYRALRVQMLREVAA